MKTSIIEYYQGMDLETVIGSRQYIVQIRNNQPIEITMRDSSKKKKKIKKDSWCTCPVQYPHFCSRKLQFVPEYKSMWSVSWDDLPIANCFYLVSNVPQIKTRKKNSVKKYFENVIFKLNKLGAFL
jgi:hypothetical protein